VREVHTFRTGVIVSVALLVGVLALAAPQTPSRIAARVNGEEISMAELEQAASTTGIIFYLYQRYPRFAQLLVGSPEGKALLSAYRREVLEDIIRWKIVLQEARKRGITVPKEELAARVDETLEGILKRNNITQEELKRILAQRGETLEDFRARIASQVEERMLVEAVREAVTATASVSQKEVEAYYREHKDLFTDDQGNTRPLGEVQEKILSDLLEHKRNELWRKWLEEARAKAQVEIKI